MSNTNFTAGDSPAMARAIEQARQSFPFFWREVSWEQRRIIPALGLCAIKLPFPVPGTDGEAEHMWVTDVAFDGHELRGTLLNSADAIPGLEAGQDVSAPLAQLEDWMYLSQDVVCGGFTVQALRAEMSPAERESHDEAWGLPFTDPALCNITPYEVKAPEAPRGISRLWRKAAPPPGLPFAQALQAARASEHPMSENMRASMAQDLQGQPDMVRAVFDDGWTLLQRDALAGNLAPVQVLLALGADREARTPAGDTALDLAQRMGWDRVVQALG